MFGRRRTDATSARVLSLGLVRPDGDGLVGVGLARRGRRRASDERQGDGDNDEAGSSAAHGTSVC